LEAIALAVMMQALICASSPLKNSVFRQAGTVQGCTVIFDGCKPLKMGAIRKPCCRTGCPNAVEQVNFERLCQSREISDNCRGMRASGVRIAMWKIPWMVFSTD
jgi:hypothetical protein